jgi:low affinity Fe/Cu permease
MIKSIHTSIEKNFERFSEAVIRIIGSSITFIIAVCIVGYWLTQKEFWNQVEHDMVRDVLLAVTFLSFFIVQKSVNRYSAAMHLKLNELIASHDKASNKVVNIEGKSEAEIRTLSKGYEAIAQKHNDLP